MNRKMFYSVLLSSLILVACNSTQPTIPETTVEGKEGVISDATKTVVENVQEIQQKQQKKVTPTTTIGGIKYIKGSSLMEEQGLFHIKSFMGTLKPTLESAMKDGVETGFGVCASIAMQMTDEYNSLTTDTKIRRTAMKYRNPKNKPDEIDKKVMNELLRKSDFKPVTIDAGDHYRVYKPLPTKSECLVCHGDVSRIPPKISKMIKRKYPKDLAIDFMEGDFRGAIVAEIKK